MTPDRSDPHASAMGRPRRPLDTSESAPAPWWSAPYELRAQARMEAELTRNRPHPIQMLFSGKQKSWTTLPDAIGDDGDGDGAGAAASERRGVLEPIDATLNAARSRAISPAPGTQRREFPGRCRPADEVAPSEMRGTVPYYGLYEAEATYGDLAQPSPRVDKFKPSNGMQFSPDFKFARHRHARDQREALLSISWVHKTHASKKIRFVVQPVVAAFAYGDIFVGLTEASVPWGRGASFAVDCEGNEIEGVRPSVTYLKKNDTPTPPPAGEDHRTAVFVVTADLERDLGVVECYAPDVPPESPLYPDDPHSPRWRRTFSLEHWSSARLFVSMYSFEDSVEFVSCT